jgi:hypothetical protein
MAISFRHSGMRAKPADPDSITTNGEVLEGIGFYVNDGDYGFRVRA